MVNACFDAALARCPNVIALGEDVGKIGDVNQGFAGLQAKYGPLRVTDTGIRETTIMGQAIGMALLGLRPIAEIQYLDYILYGLQILSDDVATLHWRTKGLQKAPIIVRTRGHRLEGTATRRHFRLMFLEVRALREPAAGGAPLNSRRSGKGRAVQRR